MCDLHETKVVALRGEAEAESLNGRRRTRNLNVLAAMGRAMPPTMFLIPEDRDEEKAPVVEPGHRQVGRQPKQGRAIHLPIVDVDIHHRRHTPHDNLREEEEGDAQPVGASPPTSTINVMRQGQQAIVVDKDEAQVQVVAAEAITAVTIGAENYPRPDMAQGIKENAKGSEGAEVSNINNRIARIILVLMDLVLVYIPDQFPCPRPPLHGKSVWMLCCRWLQNVIVQHMVL